MTVKVSSIHGGEYQRIEPSSELVERLEELLAMARSGEIQQVLYAAIHYDEAISRGYAGRNVNRFSLLGGFHAAAEEYRESVVSK